MEVKVTVLPKTSIFVLQATGGDPEYTQAYLQACMEEYSALKKEMIAQASDNTTAGLTEKVLRLDKELRKCDEDLVAFQSTNSAVMFQDQGNSAFSYVTALYERLAAQEIRVRAPEVADGGSKPRAPPVAGGRSNPETAAGGERDGAPGGGERDGAPGEWRDGPGGGKRPRANRHRLFQGKTEVAAPAERAARAGPLPEDQSPEDGCDERRDRPGGKSCSRFSACRVANSWRAGRRRWRWKLRIPRRI